MATVKPKLIVFDLDFTLWPFWVDTNYKLPFKKIDGKVVDSLNKEVNYYPKVPQLLELLKTEDYQLGVASRTTEVGGANQLLKLFDWDKYFQYKEIYPGSKATHFHHFRKKSQLQYSDMLFFDDEIRNIEDLTKIGVVSILVTDGMNLEIFKAGLREYQRRNSLVK